MIVRLPARFYFDHDGRGLPSGQLLTWNERQVTVELDDASRKDFLEDATFYIEGGVAEFGRELSGLIASAKATVAILTALPDPDAAELADRFAHQTQTLAGAISEAAHLLDPAEPDYRPGYAWNV